MKVHFYTLFLVASYILLNTPALADTTTISNEGKVKIYTFPITEDIMPSTMRLVDRAVDEAEEQDADYIIIRMNTYGGLVYAADSIRTKLMKAKPPVVVFIDNNAASAGALISLACDSIYMAKGANIGAATVVSGESGQAMPDKYQSYMRSTMRSTAESHGKDTIITGNDTIIQWRRDPRIAEAMVDDRIVIKGVIDSGYTLTFTTSEAIKNGYCEGEANSMKEVINQLGVTDYVLIRYKESGMEKIIGFLMHPAVSGLLMLVIIGGLYFELLTPGVGFPLIAAIVAATLYFAPLYLDGLAENWEIVIFVAGIVLLAVEIFVIPGFGIAGISGIILIITGLTLSLVRNVAFDFSLTGVDEVAIALFRVVLSILLALGLLIVFGKNLFSTGLFKKMVLQDTQNRNEGYTSHDITHDNLVGKTGIAVTDLRPAGTVEIDNERYDVISDGELIDKGSTVEVTKAQSTYLIVQKVIEEAE